MGKDDPEDWRHLETTTASELAGAALRRAASTIPALTILCHPDPSRVGEQAPLVALRRDGQAEVSRLEPDFSAPGTELRRPLGDPRISRKPIVLRLRPDGGLELDSRETSIRLVLGGREVDGVTTMTPEQMGHGVVLLLAGRVALLLHTLEPVVNRPPSFGMVGESSPMLGLRREIERVADLDFPVLLRGESGTGKELVARAIRRAGPRRDRPYCAVNVAAIPQSLASSELFGAAKGAFSGADRKRLGYFQQADGGTLLLDEIGEMSPEVQALLLRALESGEIQSVGAERPQTIDVRLIAATDADLEQAIAEGRF